jgi:hypothetical protein
MWKRKRVTDSQRHIHLSWEIIKYKLLYYQPSKRYKEKFRPISDDEYDAMELEYLNLCLALNKPNTVVHKDYAGLKVTGDGMMEVDLSRPSVQLVLDRLYGRKK